MLAFLDFEASSLSDRSYPIEVAWVFEDGRQQSYLIRPAPGWDDWSGEAEAIHHISRDQLASEGTDHVQVGRTMVECLSGHDLLASAPSWDGKWLSYLLRSAGYPRSALRLRDSDDAHYETARGILSSVVPPDKLAATIADLLVRTEIRAPGQAPAHRALPDAIEERARWLAVRAAAEALAADLQQGA